MITIGDQAPNFSFTNQDGRSISLGDFSGKYVLLWWYPKADTPGWTIEGNGFRDRIQDFNDKNCEIVGVSFGSDADNKAFKAKAEYPYDLLTDNDKSASTAFGVITSDTGKPNRVSVLISPDGTIAKTYSSVAPAEHADEVLTDLADMTWQCPMSFITGRWSKDEERWFA